MIAKKKENGSITTCRYNSRNSFRIWLVGYKWEAADDFEFAWQANKVRFDGQAARWLNSPQRDIEGKKGKE